MIYDLVRNGLVVREGSFGKAPPVLAINKGKWLPRVVVDTPVDKLTHKKILTKTVESDRTLWQYVSTAKTVDEVQKGKLNEVSKAYYAEIRKGQDTPQGNISLSPQALQDLTSWVVYLDNHNGQSIGLEVSPDEWVQVNRAELSAVHSLCFGKLREINNSRAQHIKNINSLVSLEAIARYDITTGQPDGPSS